MIRIFIGFDAGETVAYNVLQHSIQERASHPVSFTPIRLSHLKSVLTLKRDPLQTTDYSISCFLTPFLCDYQGWAIFMNCTMICLDDIYKLWDLRDERYSVMVVKHNHQSKEATRFLDREPSTHSKKYWSSVMLFNNARCKALTPDFVNTATEQDLHQFKWLNGDELIGELPRRWNHLIGYDEPNPNAALVNFTNGGPYFKEFQNCDYSAEWFRERHGMNRVDEKTVKVAPPFTLAKSA